MRGEHASKGERLLAAWMHYKPDLNKYGGRRLPRVLKALKGWRKLTPARSRSPEAFAIWAALCNELVDGRRQHLGRGLLTVVADLCPGCSAVVASAVASLFPARTKSSRRTLRALGLLRATPALAFSPWLGLLIAPAHSQLSSAFRARRT